MKTNAITTTEAKEKLRRPEALMARPKLGFFGLGWIGKQRMEAIRHSGIADIVALCDPFADNIERFCKDNDLKNVNSYDALLQEDIQGVVIATPSALHEKQTIQALLRGKAVFCQKPVACTAAGAKHVIETARENNCLLMTDPSYRYTHSLRKIKSIIEAGDIGEVYTANLTFHSAFGPDKPWYYDPAFSGGGCTINLGIHLIDTLYWLFPDLEILNTKSSLYARGQLLQNIKTQVEDHAITNITFSNGMSVQLCCSWDLSIGKEAIIELNFYGTKGGAMFRNVNGSLYDFKSEHYKGTRRQILSLPPDDWGGKAAVHWASLLTNKNEYMDDVTGYLKIAQTLDMIYAR